MHVHYRKELIMRQFVASAFASMFLVAGCSAVPIVDETGRPVGHTHVLGSAGKDAKIVVASGAQSAAPVAPATQAGAASAATPAAAAPAQPAAPVVAADRKFRLVRAGDRITTSGQRFKKACFFGHPGSDEDPVYAVIAADGSFTIPREAVRNGEVFFNLVGAVGASEHVTSDGWLKITEESVAEGGRICYSGGLAPWDFNERDGAGNVRKVRCFALAEFVQNRDGANN